MAVALGRSRSSRWVLFGIGAGLVLRGATGHCALYEQLGIDRRDPVSADTFA